MLVLVDLCQTQHQAPGIYHGLDRQPPTEPLTWSTLLSKGISQSEGFVQGYRISDSVFPENSSVNAKGVHFITIPKLMRWWLANTTQLYYNDPIIKLHHLVSAKLNSVKSTPHLHVKYNWMKIIFKCDLKKISIARSMLPGYSIDAA